MFCEKCGATIADDAAFCSNCGAKVKENEPEVQDVVKTPETKALATSVLTYGIISLILSWSIPFVGVVVSYIGLKKSNEYKQLSEIPGTEANIGGIFSLIGFILGIISTVSAVITLVFVLLYIGFVLLIAFLPMLSPFFSLM